MIVLIQLFWLSSYKRFCFRVEFILMVSVLVHYAVGLSYHLLLSYM